jgi:hypothetical protein
MGYNRVDLYASVEILWGLNWKITEYLIQTFEKHRLLDSIKVVRTSLLSAVDWSRNNSCVGGISYCQTRSQVWFEKPPTPRGTLEYNVDATFLPGSGFTIVDCYD